MPLTIGPGINIGPGVEIAQGFTDGAYVYYDPDASYSGTGSTLTDLSGNGLNGTLFASPTWTTGPGAYFTLNGTSQYISTPNLYNLGIETHTVEVWVYPTASTKSIFSDASQQNNTSNYHANGGTISTSGANQVYTVGLWNGSSPSGAVAGTGSYLNQWQQVVRTYDGTTCTGYVNGVAGNSVTVSWVSPKDNGQGNVWYLNFGNAETTSFSGIATAGWFAGRIGVIRIYYSALTAAQVLQNFNATKGGYGL